ncbi:hypothetical protein QJQ45_015791 [Haematococcus lacustris]|nr:hypothetical protein QJQ45_015791 [Haematococcus lacustris]
MGSQEKPDLARLRRFSWFGLHSCKLTPADTQGIGTRGGWGPKAVLQACRKVVERANSGKPTDRVPGKVVTVDEFRTRRVSSAMNSPQPCEAGLDRSKPTRLEGWKPQPGQVQHRLLQSAWSKRFEAPVRGLMWCPWLHQATPGDLGKWVDRDCNAALNLQRAGESKWRPLELCRWQHRGAAPAKGKEYPALGFEKLRDPAPKAQAQQPLEEEMAELSMKRHNHAKQLVVFFGAATIGTGGGWGADAVLRACCKVVCRPRGAGQRRGRVVLVDEHRTSRVSSAVNGQQPCEEELDKLSATRPAGWKPPAGQVEPRLLRPALSQERDQPVRGLMWCPVVAPRKPPQAPRSSQAATQPAASEPGPSTPPPAKRSKPAAEPTKGRGKGKGKATKAKPAPQPGKWLDRDCNAALNMQRIGESRWRPLELCYWPDQGALPAKGKEYPGLGYKRIRDAMELLTNARVLEHLMRGPHHRGIRLLPGKVAVFEQPSNAWLIAMRGALAGGQQLPQRKRHQHHHQHQGVVPAPGAPHQLVGQGAVLQHRAMARKKRKIPAKQKQGPTKKSKATRSAQGNQRQDRRDGWKTQRRQLQKDMAEVSMQRHGRAKQLLVLLSTASIGTGGGWGADAVLRACCKVVCRPRGTDQLRGRVVLVDEHRTSRVSSAVNGQQLAPRKPPQAPCSSQAATQPAASKPGSSTPLPAKRSKRTKAEPAAEPTKGTGKAQGKAAKAKPAPQPGRWLERDCNAALNMQRIGESRLRPLELCRWPDQTALPAKGKEYPEMGYKRLGDKPPRAQLASAAQ